MGDWTFFSNYGHVLVCLARNADARLRDVAVEVGITERAVQKIVRDLQDAGYLVVTKQGRCNRYRINRRKTLRHDLESHVTVGKLLRLVAGSEPPAARTPATEIPRPESSPEPTAEPSAEPGTVAESSEPAPKEQKKGKEKKGPVDTRQQGSLF
jgi:DNA-binding IscR family transcriptional regulator